MIPINRLGRIKGGQDQGRFVLGKDDEARTGGYLVLVASDRDLSTDAADYWVPNAAALEKFVRESRWLVEWEDDPIAGSSQSSPR